MTTEDKSRGPAGAPIHAGQKDQGARSNPKTPALGAAALREYIEYGFALVPIPAGTKGPRTKGWNQRENCWRTVADARPHAGNIGLAHAYSNTASLDIDSYASAVPALAARGVDLVALLAAGDAVQINSGRPDRAKLLYRLPAGVAPLPSVDRTDAGEGFEFRCGTKDGLTVQDVLPPSIHPDTGKPYEWAGDGDWHELPELPVEVLSAWRSLLGPQRSMKPPGGQTTAISEGRHADVLKLAARVARMVFKSGLSDEAGLAMLHAEQARGRWTRDVTDELHRGYADALTKFRSGFWLSERPRAVTALDDPWPPELVDESAHPQSDHANAHRVVRHFGSDLMYVRELGWHTFGDGPWKQDELAARMTAAGLGRVVLTEARALLMAAGKIEGSEERKRAMDAAEGRTKWARTCESRTSISNALAMSEPMLKVNVDRIDADPYLLACTNGVLDLRTGKLRPHRRTDFITQCAASGFDENATATRWERFVAEVFGHDAELIEWMRRYLGLCLSGLTNEHLLVIAHGDGLNGKTTLFDCMRQMLGTYGKVAAPGLLIAKKNQQHPTEIIDLLGARLVVSSESGEGGKLAEELAKQLSGGDGLKGRGMHKDFVQFNPTFKLALLTNHKPIITGSDNGVWRRIRLVPFAQKFEGDAVDKHLPEKLKAEWPGILRWCVEGFLAWQASGFNRCSVIEAASARYREESDLLGQFIADECVLGLAYTETSGELYRAYRVWAILNGAYPLSQRTLGLRLEERGFVQRKGTGGVRRWQGLMLGHSFEGTNSCAA